MQIKKMVVSPFQTNCYIVYENSKALIIDPGDQAKKIKTFVQDNELEVLAILLTHGHCDHIGATDPLYQCYRCPIYLQEEDFPYLKDAAINLSTMLSDALMIYAPVTKAPQTLKIGEFNIVWHHLPGHTPGSSMIEFIDENIIFSGDVIFKDSIGRYDFPLSSRHDTRETLAKLKAFDHDAVIYPGHGEKTTMKEEQLNNPFLNM